MVNHYDWHLIVEMYKKRLTCSQICSRMGINKEVLWKGLRRRGIYIGRKTPHWPKAQVEQLVSLRKQGLTFNQISIKLNLTRDQIAGRVRRLKKEGLL